MCVSPFFYGWCLNMFDTFCRLTLKKETALFDGHDGSQDCLECFERKKNRSTGGISPTTSHDTIAMHWMPPAVLLLASFDYMCMHELSASTINCTAAKKLGDSIFDVSEGTPVVPYSSFRLVDVHKKKLPCMGANRNEQIQQSFSGCVSLGGRDIFLWDCDLIGPCFFSNEFW